MIRGKVEQTPKPTVVGPGKWIESIDSLIDWQRLARLVDWTERLVDNPPLNHSPVTLLKTFLIQQWFGFAAHELDHELEDRRSLRRFIGLQKGEQPPKNEDLIRFRRALDDSGIAGEVFAQLREQLVSADVIKDALGAGPAETDADPFTLATDVRMFRPPGWVSIEKSFLEHWHARRGDGELPVFRNDETDLAPEDIRPYLVVIRSRDNGESFRYEHFGSEVVRGNQANLVGVDVIRKAAANKANYGHEGVQSELLSVLRSAVKRARPVGMSSHMFNAAGNRCHIWALFAPVETLPADGEDQSCDGTALAGVVMISRIEPLFAVISSDSQQVFAKPDLAALSKFARPPGPPEWAELERKFLSYWDSRRGGRKSPYLRDIKLSDIPDLAPNLTLIRVLQPDIDFLYEFVGDQIEDGNEGKIEGGVIGKRIARNMKEYGHAGLQGDLAESFRSAVFGIAPSATSRHFVNAKNHVRQLWSLQAPLSNDDGEVAMLMGVMLVKPLSAN